VKGDCADLCGALDTLVPLAGCASQRDDWQSCIGSPANACQKDCSIALQDLRACVGSYCAGDPLSDACQTLKASF
jgi:5,10-methenyltetrahydromethanopterin hydrogenase